ncbi:hypothetical protein [Streptomyces sp. NPDC056987]|uniref:hypothetical protein n=1 Tax=Streptomyces sp. NPDC056987 TaxID=3345988 RepID=UPI003644B917
MLEVILGADAFGVAQAEAVSPPGSRRHPAMPVPAARVMELAAAAVRGPAGFQME